MNDNNWSSSRTCDKCSRAFRLSDHTKPGAMQIARALDNGTSTKNLPMVMEALCPQCYDAWILETFAEVARHVKEHPVRIAIKYSLGPFSWLGKVMLMAIGVILTFGVLYLFSHCVPVFGWQVLVIALGLVAPALYGLKIEAEIVFIPLFSAACVAAASVFHIFSDALTWQASLIVSAATTLTIDLIWAVFSILKVYWKSRIKMDK